MAKKKILILGAGLAGLSAAWHLQKKGVDCQVFEKEPEIGGLCRSKAMDGFTFDICGHLMHFKYRYTFNLIKDLLGDELCKHQRSSWIYSYGRYIRYPFQVNLYDLPKDISKECLIGFITASKNSRYCDKKRSTFLEWINKTLGRGIAKHFMVPYNTKFWTVSPKKLTCEWLDGFIPVPSLSEIIDGTIQESNRQFGYNARFWYPKKGGVMALPLALAGSIKNVHTNCQVIEIDINKKEIKMASGNKEKFDYLISTIPLPEMPYLIRKLPQTIKSAFKLLKWNSIFNLNLGIEQNDYSGRHWVYFPEKEFCFFRVGFFHNLSSNLAPFGKNSLYVEVSHSKNRPVDKNNITLNIKKQLEHIGLVVSQDRICVQNINDIKYGYPIYDNYYNPARTEIIKYLMSKNILSCGRYGSWRYLSMEDAVLDGKRIANILPN